MVLVADYFVVTILVKRSGGRRVLKEAATAAAAADQPYNLSINSWSPSQLLLKR